MEAKKSLGQNFLKDELILQNIANSFPIHKNDLIIEVGPGKGALTKYLIAKKCFLLTYEIDERMKDILVSFHNEKTEIIFDDFLNRDIKNDIKRAYEHIYIIANIPYYITTPIIEHIIMSNISITGMALLMQKEVADRLCATPGSRDYGYITVYLNYFFKMEKLFLVPAQAFDPKPKVDSEVVRFQSIDKVSIDILGYQRFLKKAFSQKRKTLHNNLKEEWEKVYPVLKNNGVHESVRAEEISSSLFIKLYEASIKN